MGATRKWAVDLSVPRTSSDAALNPLGFVSGELAKAGNRSSMGKKEQMALKQKRAMDMAISPAKGIAMNAFMMYMSGKGINIFSIMITVMALMNPAKAIMGTTAMFLKLDPDRKLDTRLPKLIFIAVNIAGIGIALYKLAAMGLLPVTSADWLSYLPLKPPLEYSAPSLPL